MNLYLTESFQDKACKLCRKDNELKISLKKQFSLFQQNPRHPSLRLHKLQGKRLQQHAMWIKGDLRALFIKEDGKYIFFDLVTHDQY
jgi:mRNA-degrading endonuclease YafQ of YafQ-DinJ toxin-antitoxin module